MDWRSGGAGKGAVGVSARGRSNAPLEALPGEVAGMNLFRYFFPSTCALVRAIELHKAAAEARAAV